MDGWIKTKISTVVVVQLFQTKSAKDLIQYDW